jgi:hypothetical protein
MFIGETSAGSAQLSSGRSAHEIFPIDVQPRDLKNIQHIMDVLLLEAPRQHGPDQVRMALEVELVAAQKGIDIGIASSAEQVMATSADLVNAIVGERVSYDGG